MSDLISRQDTIDAMYQLEAEDIETYGCFIPEGFHANQAVEALEALPSAEPHRKKGKWWHYEGMLTCSECGMEFYDDIEEYCGDDVPKFCPDCGAEMSGVNDE